MLLNLSSAIGLTLSHRRQEGDMYTWV